jgi:hypothetical protein
MTCNEFNEKYNNWLEGGYYGLNIENDVVIDYLDKEFKDFIKIPEFCYKQIKTKFRSARFYCDGLSSYTIDRIEQTINKILYEQTLN